MADSVTMDIQGLDELVKKMRELSPKLARNGLRAAVNAGAQVVKKEAASRVPVDTGALKRAVYAKQIRELSGDTQQTFYVAVRQGRRERAKNRDGWHWRFIEFGTKSMPARPFLRPALDVKKTEAAERIKTKLIERIEKIAGEK
jgi:HK97 gp10 family phage protein